MELKHLRTIVTVADEGGFRLAAKRLGISQPSLSQQISKLEDQVGCMLFDREPGGISLTHCGDLLYQRAVQILSMVEEAEQVLQRESSDQRSVVSVAAIPTMAPFVLPRAIVLAKQSIPSIAINVLELPTEQLLDSVTRGGSDIGVLSTFSENRNNRFIAEHICHEPLRLAMATDSEWARLPKLCREHLQAAGVLMLSDVHCLSSQVMDFCESQSIDQIVQVESDQIATIIEFVRRDLGVTLLPASILACHDTTGLMIRDPQGPTRTRPVLAVQRRHRQASDTVTAMLGCIAQAYMQFSDA